MNVPKLVGAVSAAVLREQLQPDQSGTQSTGRFVLNLNPEQVAAVAHAVIADPFLNERSTSNFQNRTSATSACPRTRLPRGPRPTTETPAARRPRIFSPRWSTMSKLHSTS